MSNYTFDDNGNALAPESKSVTEINEYIKWLIDGEMQLQDVYVVGELSNFKRHTSGHCYFSLKDEHSEIRGVMFSSNARKLIFKPENGMKVIVRARVSVYPQGGTYQLYVSSMQPDGLGSLHLAFEQLKSKLAAEGLFDDIYKKVIPKYPRTIGLITSATGAAVRDIINVSKRRYPCVKLVLYPTLVQGPDAPQELIKAVEYFNIANNVDVIIIGRGGGSIEDLWAFNDEGLARAIFKSEIPVISAVGHEIDFTICDFVSDVRAPTPSAAAEIATPDMNEIIYSLTTAKQRMQGALASSLKDYKARFKTLKESRIFKNPLSMLDVPKMRFLTNVENLVGSMNEIQNEKKKQFIEINAKLSALNPMAVIARGYGAVFSDEKIIKSVKSINVGDVVTVVLSDGKLKATVNAREEAENAKKDTNI